ncbi:NAD-dependent epimerase/dehydratase family protein [Castellaniella sp.]|uniref:NAD-dependent epimerase/dehydratase family protein n=1 Tax=Castellaniella sp. TaxID=1955812 RepID=UPI0025C05A64|nr:NAD-dependent epimerase/dehydratase family protein [Castellaniella sp.]
MNTLLLIGGDLCMRTAGRLDSAEWQCAGLRRRPVLATPGSRIRWFQADLRDPASLSAALSAIPPTTHLLYAPAPDARTPETYVQVYPEGLRTLLETLPEPERLRRCVMVDSTAVWGPSNAWVDEETPANPEDFRGASMLAAEALLHEQLTGRFQNVIGTALRLSGLYGPGRLRLIEGLRSGRIKAPTGPGHWANRIHIEDAASACAHLLALPKPLSCYIGTDDHPLPTADLYDALARMADCHLPDRETRPPDGKRLSNARLRASGWTPQWPDMTTGYAQALVSAARSAPPIRCAEAARPPRTAPPRRSPT